MSKTRENVHQNEGKHDQDRQQNAPCGTHTDEEAYAAGANLVLRGFIFLNVLYLRNLEKHLCRRHAKHICLSHTNM